MTTISIKDKILSQMGAVSTDGESTYTGTIDAAGVIINPSELAKLDGVTTNIQTQLDDRALAADLIDALAEIELRAPLVSPAFTGTVTGIDKAMVGLGDVDNTSDLAKPISTLTQTALNSKADLVDGKVLASQLPSYVSDIVPYNDLASFPTTGDTTKIYIASDTNTPYRWTGLAYVSVGLAGGTISATNVELQPIGTVAATDMQAAIAELDSEKAPLASPAFTGTVSGIDKAMVGLGDVDNTSDLLKPISTATQTALADKSPLASPAFTGVPTGPTAVAGTNTTQLATTEFVSTTLADKAPLESPTFTGTVNGITKAMVGLANVNNTSDLAKPISSATQSALDAKASLSSPTFTGTPLAPTASTGTSNTQVATTAFVATAISSLTNKADIASPTFTGVPAAPTAASGTNTTQVATTAFVTGALTSKADLDSSTGKIKTNQLPDTILGQLEFISNWDFVNALPAATAANKGNFYIASNAAAQNGYIMGDWAVSIGTDWVKIDNTDAVVSVAGLMGTITVAQLLTALSLDKVSNTSDAAKPVSTAQQTALDLKLDKTGGTATGALTATAMSDSLGNLRSVPITSKSAAYTLTATDKGTRINTTAAVTVPASIFAANDVVLIRNTSAANITLTCSAVTAYLDGNTAAKTSMTIAAGSIAGIQFDSASSIFVTGKGVS